jgi:drug/metabolite transporter (DMT)-like permease
MRNWILLFACNLMWALQFTCIKLVEDQVGGYMTVWVPMLLATVGLIPFVLAEARRHRSVRVTNKRDVVNFLILAAFGFFPAQVFMTWGTRMSLASNGALLTLALPVFTAVMAMLILKEKMNRARWISFSFAIVGVVIISAKDIQGTHFAFQYLAGDLLILTAILGNSLNNSFGKVILRRFTPLEMLFWTYCLMLVLLLPFVIPELGPFLSSVPNFTANTWIGMILLTFFHNYLSMIIFLRVLKELDAIQVALTNYLITFFGLPIAAITLGERLSPLAIIGGIFVLGSTLLITIWDKPTEAAIEVPVPTDADKHDPK